MKKILTILLLATLLIGCATAVAYAETTEQRITTIAASNEKVTAAECVIYNRSCLVAIKTEKFNTKSDYDKYVEDVTEQIKSECEIDNVFITRSPKVMFKLKELNKLDETERNKVIEEMIERELHRRDPKPIEPRMLNR